MPPKLFDAHTHVQFHAFSEDADLVIRRALRAGIWMVNVGTQRDTSQNAIEIAEKYPEGVYATVGLHPIHTEKSHHDAKELGDSQEAQGFTSRGEEFDYKYYKTLSKHPKVVAIGECGLDYYRLGDETKKKQGAVFLEHIRLAREVAKPLMIHCRNAFGDLVRILEHHKNDLPDPCGIIHFFSGSVEDARALLDLGFSFSFGGVITFVPRSPKATGIPVVSGGLGIRDYNEVIKFIPLERILLETDAPYVAPAPYRGKRNEPMYIEEVAKKLAAVKEVSFEDVALRTTQSAIRIFLIKEPPGEVRS